MKRIVLTGGGTAGHVTPNLSLIPRLIAAGYDVHYIGTEHGIERGMIAQVPGVTYHVVQSGKLRRYFSLQNFTDPFRVLHGAFTSVSLMRRLKPDVCFSKGGFVGVPVVIGAWLAHVPTVCHESDLTPGLANRISARFVDRIATTFEECAKTLGKKAVATGTPLRPSLFQGSRERGLARVLNQQDMTRETMTRALLDLLRDRETLRAAVAAYPVKDGTDAVLALIEQVQQGR